MKKVFIALILFLTGCIRIPENVKPVDGFKIEKYMMKCLNMNILPEAMPIK